jgi:YHS domain-containing protein
MLCEPDACVIDPVCGMRIAPGPTTPTIVTDTGQDWFCSSACLEQSTMAALPEVAAP